MPATAEKLSETDPQTLTARLAAANVNTDTYLATDYLNHFNQALMLLEMSGDMPEMLEELAEWQPRSYAEHFDASGFEEREFIVAAYDAAPEPTKSKFDDCIGRLDMAFVTAIETASQSGDAERGRLVAELVPAIQDLIVEAYGLINGSANALQEDVDESFGDTVSQDDIDSLFD